jgi:hypothetical protein
MTIFTIVLTKEKPLITIFYGYQEPIPESVVDEVLMLDKCRNIIEKSSISSENNDNTSMVSSDSSNEEKDFVDIFNTKLNQAGRG